jgi:hypothetical protein
VATSPTVPCTLAELGPAWDAALDDRAARRAFCDRAHAIGASGGDAAWLAVRREVERDLADVARSGGVPLGDLRGVGGVAARAAEILREELLSELELAGTALRARVDTKRQLAAVDEWREFLTLRAAYGRAVELGGAEVRRLAFSRLKNDVWSHAYWLSSERSESTLANAMYAWLLAEAHAVDDSRAIDPLTGNVEATAARDPMNR